MKQSDSPLKARVAHRPAIVEPEGPLEWTVRVENSSPDTLHVATSIQQIDASEDGKTLRISTVRPVFDPSVSLAFFNLETTPVQPGESLDQAFAVELPLHLVTLAGFPLRAETRLWTPAPGFTLVTELAYGDRPYHPPADPRRQAQSLRQWTRVLRAPVMRLKTRTIEKE